MKTQVNSWCGLKTGDDTVNPRLLVEITIPRFRVNLTIQEALALSRALADAVKMAANHVKG